MLLQPEQVAAGSGGGGDDHVGVVGEAGDREVGLDAAALIEPLSVDGAAGGAADVVGADALQSALGVGAAHGELGEGGLVEEADGSAGGAALLRAALEPVL